MQDRVLRSLVRLQNSGATSRVLNLNRTEREFGATEEHRTRPFFRNPVLNKSLIVKHRLREQERDLFEDYRANATKLIIPIDRDDLTSGGAYCYVGQRGYEAILGTLLNDSVDGMVDRKTLSVLERLPSFDPFLLREQLRRHDLTPANCYFDISPGDLRRMFAFLQSELSELVGMSMRAGVGDLSASTAALAQKILSNTAGEDMEPLRLTLRLEKEEYLEGVFCWKGFLYYKWKLIDLTASAPALAKQIATLKPYGRSEPDAVNYIEEAKSRVLHAVAEGRREVQATLAVYDEAYRGLTRAGEPMAFRNFLLNAPAMFLRLGERLGVLDHISSFCAYRFAPAKAQRIPAEELMDTFLDFENSLGLTTREAGQSWGVGLAMAG